MKDATRLKLLIAGLALMTIAVASWVAVISWGEGKCDRGKIFFILRCIYSAGFAAFYGALLHYSQEQGQRLPFRRWKVIRYTPQPWDIILLTILGTFIGTVFLVEGLLKWYPDGLCSIRCVLIYTIGIVLLLGIAPLAHYCARQYRKRRNRTLSNDPGSGLDENKKT